MVNTLPGTLGAAFMGYMEQAIWLLTDLGHKKYMFPNRDKRYFQGH